MQERKTQCFCTLQRYPVSCYSSRCVRALVLEVHNSHFWNRFGRNSVQGMSAWVQFFFSLNPYIDSAIFDLEIVKGIKLSEFQTLYLPAPKWKRHPENHLVQWMNPIWVTALTQKNHTNSWVKVVTSFSTHSFRRQHRDNTLKVLPLLNSAPAHHDIHTKISLRPAERL